MMSRSYQSCESVTSATTVMNNTKRPLYTLHNTSLQQSPGINGHHHQIRNSIKMTK